MRLARRVALSVLAALALLVAALGWALASPGALRWATEHVVAASGGRLQLEDVSGSLARGLDVGELRWRGDPAAPGLALTLRNVRADWRLLSLLRGEVDLAELRAASVEVALAPSDEPAVLPQALSLPVSLRIRGVRIDELRVQPAVGAPVVLGAVELAARYAGGRYSLERLEADTPWGHARMSGTVMDAPPYAVELGAVLDLSLAPQPVPVEAKARGSLSELVLDATSGSPEFGSAKARAVLRPFDAQPLGEVALEVDALDLAALGLTPGRRTQLAGRASLAPESTAAAGSVVALAGKFELENRLSGPLEAGRLPLSRLAAAYRWQGSEGLRLSALRVEFPGGGRIEGEIRIDPSRSLALPGATMPWLALDLAVSGLDLRAVSTGLPRTSLAGSADSDGERFDVDLADAARGGMSLRARGRVDDERLLIENAQLLAASAGARLSVKGSAGVRAPHALALEGSFDRLDPSRLPALLALAAGSPAGDRAAARGAEPSAPQHWLARLAGAIDGRWALRGTLPAGGEPLPRPPAPLHAELEVTGGTLAGMPASARLDADIDGIRLDGVALDRLRVRVSRLEAGLGSTRLQAQGVLGAPGDRLAFQLRAPALAQLDALIGEAGLAGALSADGELSGRLSAPGVTLRAKGSNLALGQAGRVAQATLSLAFPPDAGSMLDAALALKLEARDLLAGATALRSVRVDGEGSLRRHSLRVSLDGARGGAQAALSGGMPDASRWTGEIRELSVSGALPARLAAPAAIEVEQVAGGVAGRVGAVVVEGDFGAVRVARASWRDGRAELVADATLSRLGRLAVALGASTGNGNGAASEALDSLVLGLRVDVSGSSLSDATGSLVARLESPPGGVGDGRADLTLRAGALTGPLELTLPTLSFANRMIGPQWAVDGRIRFAGRVSGTLAEPRLVGDVEGSGLTLQQRAMGWKLRDGTLAGRFDGERFRLASMKLFSGPQGSEGSVELRGEVRVADLEGRFDLVADRFAVLIGPGQRVVVSGRGEASSTAGAFEIKGNLRADEGRIELAGGDAPTLPEDVVVVSAADRAAGTPAAAARRTSLRLASDVTLDLGENLRVRGSGIDARLAGSINLRGTLPDAPRAHGTVRIRDGRYRAYGQELQITRGLIVFNGPLDNPALDIVALRRGLAVEAGVAVTGTVLSPQVRLTSRPDVPDAEKLSWLVLGVPLDDARSGGQGAALQAAAATLFGRNDGAMAGGVASTLGLDVLTIRSASTGPGGLLPSGFGGGLGSTLPPIPGQVGSTRTGAYGAGQSGNVLAVGKRLSSRVMVTYEQGLHGVWNLLRIQYDITRRLSLRAQTGSESAIDVLYWHAFD